MELTKFEITVLLKHYWKQDYKAAATARRICEVEGEGVVIDCVAQQWFQRFNTGEENTKNLQRAGRPKLCDIENIAEFWKKIRKIVLVGSQKNFVHQKILYIVRLRHLEENTEAVNLYFMNSNFNRFNVEWISVVSLSHG